jgi:hypothetical protein
MMRACIFFILAMAIGCTKQAPPQANRLEAFKVELAKYFDVPIDPNFPLAGIFKVDEDSLSKTLERKYLGSYKAQPDEPSLEIIRTRMKNTTIFIRISTSGQIAMATISPGNIGFSQGVLAKQPLRGAVMLWRGKLKNKKGETQVTITHANTKSVPKLEYNEGDTKLIATREPRPADTLTTTYMQTISQTTGLTEY